MLSTIVEDLIRPLTRREMQILTQIAEGNSNKQIASILGVTEQTVKNHVTAILSKLNANHRAHAVSLAMRNGLISTQFNTSGSQTEKQSSSKPPETELTINKKNGQASTYISAIAGIEDFLNKGLCPKEDPDSCIRCNRLRDHDEVLKFMAEALHKLDPQIIEKIRQVSREYRQNRLTEMMSTVNAFINYFLDHRETGTTPRKEIVSRKSILPDLIQRLDLPPVRPSSFDSSDTHSPKKMIRSLQADLCLPPNNKSQLRAWSDNGDNKVKINMLHEDFLSSEKDDNRYAWYLFSIWAKQVLLSNYENDSGALADEVVGLFCRAGPLLNHFVSRPRTASRNVEAVKS